MMKYKFLMGFLFVIISLITISYWLYPSNIEKKHSQKNHVNSEISPLPQEKNNHAIFASTSQQDTQINCQLTISNKHQLIVNEQTKNCFEYFITQYGEKKVDQIDRDFKAYMKQNYKNPALSQVLDLWNRYIQYRTQLPNISAPSNTVTNTPKHYWAIFNNMQNLRKQFFSDREIEGLFGEENTYHIYTIKRMEVLTDKQLNEQEKAKKLKSLFKDLPISWQENLEQLNKLEDLQQLTADIKARRGTTEEIRQMRINLLGTAATERLEKLDTQRVNWRTKIDQYILQRDTIMKSNIQNSIKAKEIQELRESHFSNPQEQLRVEAFERIHDQGGKFSFLE